MQLRQLRAGSLLVATPLLVDPNFARTVVLILQHDEDGSIGVVLDRPTRIPVSEYLPEWDHPAAEPRVVFAGGPVEGEVGIGVSIRFGSIELVDLTAEPRDDTPVRIFGGCAGWAPGQLAGELEEQAWFLVDFHPDDLLTDEPESLWSRVLRRQTSGLAMYANFPGDPRMN